MRHGWPSRLLAGQDAVLHTGRNRCCQRSLFGLFNTSAARGPAVGASPCHKRCCRPACDPNATTLGFAAQPSSTRGGSRCASAGFQGSETNDRELGPPQVRYGKFGVFQFEAMRCALSHRRRHARVRMPWRSELLAQLLARGRAPVSGRYTGWSFHGPVCGTLRALRLLRTATLECKHLRGRRCYVASMWRHQRRRSRFRGELLTCRLAGQGGETGWRLFEHRRDRRARSTVRGKACLRGAASASAAGADAYRC
mmetsp:Transcript_80087/g.222962  ORF Transcript_80087/g.222962 Transcript_80087/m.222962 type:complete len:254 (-) Transcript_80087:740-1501(-)